MRTRIKICGIREPDHAQAAADAGADAIGLVFVDASPRRVTVERARRVIASLPSFVEPIGLFVDAGNEQVRATCGRLGLRTAQLHGNESPEDAADLAPLRVIKAIPFDTPDTAAGAVDRWRQVPTISGILFDAPSGNAAAPAGGTGSVLDWVALATLVGEADRRNFPNPLLAGGLTPENVAEAIRTVRPWAVDVSTGVEATRGEKDPRRIAAFCRSVRSADNDPCALAEGEPHA